MAAEVAQYLREQLANLPPDHPDRRFLEGLHQVVSTYVDAQSTNGMGEVVHASKTDPFTVQMDLSMVPQPFDVEREDADNTMLLHFIASLDLEKSLQEALIRYSVDPSRTKEFSPNTYQLHTIRDLFMLALHGPLDGISRIGKNRSQHLQRILQDIIDTGQMPQIDEQVREDNLRSAKRTRDLTLLSIQTKAVPR